MYRLDLSERDQNLVAQSLVDLAITEPGENWVGETLNGREFELPSTWIKQVPLRGFLEVHYHTDHMSEETIKSKLKRGDNIDTRTRWLKRTLIWQEGMHVEDIGYDGNRDDWCNQRSWKIVRPRAPRKSVVANMDTRKMVKKLEKIGWELGNDEDGFPIYTSPEGEVFEDAMQALIHAMQTDKETLEQEMGLTVNMGGPSGIKMSVDSFDLHSFDLAVDNIEVPSEVPVSVPSLPGDLQERSVDDILENTLGKPKDFQDASKQQSESEDEADFALSRTGSLDYDITFIERTHSEFTHCTNKALPNNGQALEDVLRERFESITSSRLATEKEFPGDFHGAPGASKNASFDVQSKSTSVDLLEDAKGLLEDAKGLVFEISE